MQTYIAFLRGINVGGNSLIKMAELKESLTKNGFSNVRTYIQSGNVIFDSENKDPSELAREISAAIKDSFNLTVTTVVIPKEAWHAVVSKAPKWWGDDKEWKHNLLILLEPYDMEQILQEIGVLKPEIENLAPGAGVIYQSVSWEKFGRATSGKLASKPCYKSMTIRNYNTVTKLDALLA